MTNNVFCCKNRRPIKQLLNYYYEQKESKSAILTFKKITKSIAEEIKSRNNFYQIIPNGIGLTFQLKNYFEGFEKFIDYKDLSVYESEITISDIDPNQKESSRLYKMVNQLIDIENKIAEFSKEKCQKVYLIRKNNIIFSSIDDPIKRAIYDCILTEKVIFIGIPK